MAALKPLAYYSAQAASVSAIGMSEFMCLPQPVFDRTETFHAARLESYALSY